MTIDQNIDGFNNVLNSKSSSSNNVRGTEIMTVTPDISLPESEPSSVQINGIHSFESPTMQAKEHESPEVTSSTGFHFLYSPGQLVDLTTSPKRSDSMDYTPSFSEFSINRPNSSKMMESYPSSSKMLENLPKSPQILEVYPSSSQTFIKHEVFRKSLPKRPPSSR